MDHGFFKKIHYFSKYEDQLQLQIYERLSDNKSSEYESKLQARTLSEMSSLYEGARRWLNQDLLSSPPLQKKGPPWMPQLMSCQLAWWVLFASQTVQTNMACK